MENKRTIKVVILAAGQSTRMKSSKSKILHKILGKEIINFTLDAVLNAGIKEENIIIVAGENREELEKVVDKKVNYVIQEERLGTAHALLTAYELLKNNICDTLVLVGDNPYITTEEIKKIINFHNLNKSDASLITAVFPETPPPYGRIIRDKDSTIKCIVEEIDASEEQKKIREVNSSIYLFKNEVVLELLKKIDNKNKKGEYYLTDIIEIIQNENKKVHGLVALDHRVAIGINDRWDLQNAQNYFRLKQIKQTSLEDGVTFLDPSTTTVEMDVSIGKDTVIYPSTYISKGSIIGDNCEIGPFTYIKKSIIRSNSKVEYKMVNDK
jgi:bifunctional UDP-N-acetylglucosamine pyrophosphorylase/glucosamine-1-phosphate N-acetyltransferase